MAKTKQSLFVLFASPPQQVASGACYIALDGYPTIMRSHAARFHRFADAQAFAEENRIALNGHAYKGLEDFTDVAIQEQEPFET